MDFLESFFFWFFNLFIFVKGNLSFGGIVRGCVFFLCEGRRESKVGGKTELLFCGFMVD